MTFFDSARQYGLHDLLFSLDQQAEAEERINNILATARNCLGMDIGFIAEFAGSRRFFRYVDTGLRDAALRTGDWLPMDEGYCQRIIDGELPELIPDTALLPEAQAIAATHAFPIGSHMSVPIRLGDGRLYGTFCCFSTRPDSTLNKRDLQILRSFAQFAAFELDRNIEKRINYWDAEARILDALERDGLGMVYQPIVSLDEGEVIGFEALARFPFTPSRPPNIWFAEAFEVGRGIDLELKAIRMGLEYVRRLPEGIYLALNASPATLIDPRFAELMRSQRLERVVIEVTEHASIYDYDRLAAALAPLRALGMRLAVDDAGAGYASLRHILNLKPDIIKLDAELCRDIEEDPARRALAASLVSFTRDIRCTLVAEGVETAETLEALKALGIGAAQGFHVGRPMPAADIGEWRPVSAENAPPLVAAPAD
ncbi:MAG: diguanylate phosphodiesterase [Shinella sp.]|nr:MAG: diguanylate phosphodiesterase [Shinella sp.]